MSSVQLDPGSPYAELHHNRNGDYWVITLAEHKLSGTRGRLRLHRAVLFDSIGDGPHRCHWCGVDGLRWDLKNRTDASYLVVDHLNGNGSDNRLCNLVPAHAWCNGNRAMVEHLGIPWSVIERMPVTARPALRRDGKPTQAALALARGSRAEPVTQIAVEPSVSTAPPEGEGTASPSPSSLLPARRRLYVWDDFADTEALKGGVVALKSPPEWLMAKHPQLRTVDFTRFGR